MAPPGYESSGDDSSEDEGGFPEFGPAYNDQWELGDTGQDDGEFAELSDLWDDTAPLTEGRGRKYTFSGKK